MLFLSFLKNYRLGLKHFLHLTQITNMLYELVLSSYASDCPTYLLSNEATILPRTYKNHFSYRVDELGEMIFYRCNYSSQFL
jgi:hypothetical protein